MTFLLAWMGRQRFPFLMVLASTALLTLAFAPVGQFYLAWVGLAPWLLMLRSARSQASAFLWSWIGGTLFFSANMWWMANISVPGMIALMVYCGIYWGFAALVIRGAGLLDGGTVGNARQRPVLGILAVATIWVAFEWLRGNLMTGLPWLFLGHAQTPILPMCQVADALGAYGVSFWVVAVNALACLACINRANLTALIRPAISVLGLLAVVLAYGIFRIHQTPDAQSPGPMVAVVQPNAPQSNSGEKSESDEERLRFHMEQTDNALRASPNLNLVVWSETEMPPINRESRLALQDMEGFYQTLSMMTSIHHVALLTGGRYGIGWEVVTRDNLAYPIPKEQRNSAYFFDPDGHMDDSLGKRYDKIHLVPWGEFIPFKHSLPWLYNIFLALGPKYYSSYELAGGADDALTVFELSAQNHVWRFVTPICFEDIDSRICSAMFRPEGDGGKRADFLVNITNDGWFRANQNAQHLQAAVFRSIENRAPMARSVNTGISGFIDSTGRMGPTLSPRTPGFLTYRLMLDHRLTIYSCWGDLFAAVCIALSALIAIVAWIGRGGRIPKILVTGSNT